MENKKYGSFSSVDDPQKLSESVGSFIKIIGTIIGAWLAMKGSHVVIGNEAIEQTTNAFTVIITSGFAIWNSAQLIFGLFRKIVAK